ncbi:hypothetical protein GCM10008986_09680 [Salinibacillus aidingensis]|uniref:Na+/proline symporter n=1 Tax=Salinibacillus aidingensis TaxID=237684 RepID=A0ABN1AY69_9BACI
MIDWYFILFIAFGLLIVYIEKIGEHQSVNHYILFNRDAGLSEGSYALIIQFVTGGVFYLPIYITNQIQLSSFFAFVISACAIYFLLVKVTENENNKKVLSLTDKNVTNDFSLYILIVFGLSNFISLLVELSILGFLFDEVFKTSLLVGFLLFLSFVFSYFGLGGYYGVRYIGSKIFFCIYIIGVFIGLTVYMRTGIENVYEHINRNFASILDGSFIDITLITFTIIMTIFGQVCTSFYFWRSIQSIKSNHRLTALKLSIFSWSALLLLFFVLSVYLFAVSGSKGVFSFFTIISQMNGPFLSLLTILFLASITLGVSTQLYSIISIFLFILKSRTYNWTAYRLLRMGYFFGMMVTFLSGVLVMFTYKITGEWISLAIAFYSSVGIPMFLMNVKRRSHLKLYFYTTSLMIGFSILLSKWISDIWLVSPIVVIVTSMIWVVFIKLNNQKTNKIL